MTYMTEKHTLRKHQDHVIICMVINRQIDSPLQVELRRDAEHEAGEEPRQRRGRHQRREQSVKWMTKNSNCELGNQLPKRQESQFILNLHTPN